MARSREMFSEFIIGDHSGHGIRFIGHRWLLRFAVFQSDGQPNYLGKFANGFLGSLVHFYLG